MQLIILSLFSFYPGWLQIRLYRMWFFGRTMASFGSCVTGKMHWRSTKCSHSSKQVLYVQFTLFIFFLIHWFISIFFISYTSDTSCDGGQYFNMTSLLCQNCVSGHYSLGGGVIIDSFNDTLGQLPNGFHITTESTSHTPELNKKCNGLFVLFLVTVLSIIW